MHNVRKARLVASEIMNAVTIYEMDGLKYTGAQKIYVKTHPRFLSFIRLCIDNHEYSLGLDDLVRAIDGATGQPPALEDEGLEVQSV
jgi:hypothetical protein